MATRSLTITGSGNTGSLHLGRGETVHTLTVTNNTGFAAGVGALVNCTTSTTSPASGTSYVITPSASGNYSATLSWTDANKTAFNHITSGTAYSGTLSASPTNNVAGNDVTMSWTMSPSGGPTWNSSNNAFSPQTGSDTAGTSGSFALECLGDPNDGVRTNRTVTLRTPGGTTIPACVIRTVNNINIYTTPSTPADIVFSGVTETQITATASAGTNNYGTLQVRLGTVGTWLNSPQTFTGLTAGTNYTFQARQVNVIAISGTRQETQSTTQTIDETPNAFPFTDVISAYKSTTQTSNQITVAGLGTGVNASVSISGGTYSKNGGGYTSAATTAANGDTFRVRHTSSSGNYGLVTTSLTIGTVTETYSSRTIDTAITHTLTHNGSDITTFGFYNSDNGNVTVNISGGRNNTNYRGVTTAASSSPSGTATNNTGIGNNTPASTTTSLTIGDSGATEFSSIQGDQVSYKLQARTVTSLGGSGTGSWVDTGNTFTLTHIVGTPSGFTVSQGAVNASSTPITLTANGTTTPTDCVKEFRLTTAGSFGSTSTTTQNWGTTVTYATRFRNSTTNQASLFSNEITRFVGDPAVSISGGALQYNSTESFTHTRAITNTAVNTTFRVRNLQATQGNSAGATAATGTATGTSINLNLTSPTDIPTAGNTVDYVTEFRVTTANNGDGTWRSLPSGVTAQNFTIGRQSAFAYTDTTNQNLNVQQDDFVEINGLVTTVTASHSGAGSFAVSNSSTTPSSGFSTANKSVTSTNRFVHARHTSASTLSTNTDTTITIDGISDTFRSTTAASLPADVTITITFVDGIPSQNEPSFLQVSSSRNGQGTGTAGSSTSPIPLDFGDVVQFNYSGSTGTSCTISAFDAGEWTNTTSISGLTNGQNGQRIRPASGISIGEEDQVNISCSGQVPDSQVFYFVQRYNEGDATVSFPTEVNMAENDPNYTVTISARGDATNQSNTVYEIRDGSATSTLRGSRTGAGTITVTTGFPQFLGIGVEKFIYYRLPTASGGDNLKRSVVNDDGNASFTLFRGSAPGANNPTKTGYGIAIYDQNENLVTSFQENHTVLRTIFSGTINTSTSTVVDLETSISGLSNSNSVIMVTGTSNASGGSSEYPLNIPTRFNGTKVRLARWTQAISVKVTVMQYSGGTLTGTAPSYGAKIYNENGNLVLDNLASSYAVKEIITLTAGSQNGNTVNIYTGFSQSTVNYAFVELAANRYPTSGGLPIPAIACTSGNAALISPRIAGVVSGYYRYVYCTLPANVNTNNFKLAMLVERANTTPSYYGGAASSYGLQIKDASGNIQYDSSWRQAIVQNVIGCNQFTGGTVNQNGSYDVETGDDGVTEPIAQGGLFAEFTQATYSTGLTKTLTGLNSIDPTNTYLLGGFAQGGVKYYAQPWYLDGVEQETVGGGTHVPAISITGNTTAVISMFRTGGGPGPPTANDYGERVSTSSHPQGNFILARIT